VTLKTFWVNLDHFWSKHHFLGTVQWVHYQNLPLARYVSNQMLFDFHRNKFTSSKMFLPTTFFFIEKVL